MTKLYYGVKSKEQLYSMINEVCELFGGKSKENAKFLLRGTCQQETKFGRYPDDVDKNGNGLMQFDLNPFLDVQKRMLKYCSKKVKKVDKFIKEKFPNQDIKSFKDWEWDHLAGNDDDLEIYMSLIMARSLYWLRPEAIPDDLQGQAEYYKKWYNTSLGKATVEEYLKNYDELIEYLNFKEINRTDDLIDKEKDQLILDLSLALDHLITRCPREDGLVNDNDLCDKYNSTSDDSYCKQCWIKALKVEYNV